MKILQRLWINIPDQVLSTAIICSMIFVFYRGVLSVWESPPSSTACLIVLFAGIFLGVITSLTNKNNKPT